MRAGVEDVPENANGTRRKWKELDRHRSIPTRGFLPDRAIFPTQHLLYPLWLLLGQNQPIALLTLAVGREFERFSGFAARYD